MYSSLKYLSATTIVLALLNTVGAILTILFLAPMEGITYSMLMGIGLFLFSTSVIFLVLGFTLWNLYTDLTAHEDSNYEDISRLRKRVEALEKKQ